jgi:hypothetical protein
MENQTGMSFTFMVTDDSKISPVVFGSERTVDEVPEITDVPFCMLTMKSCVCVCVCVTCSMKSHSG